MHSITLEINAGLNYFTAEADLITAYEQNRCVMYVHIIGAHAVI